MPKKGEVPPWLRKRKAKLGRKFKAGTKNKKFAAARDAAAAAAAKDVQKGKRKALMSDMIEPKKVHRAAAEQAESKRRAPRTSTRTCT